MSAGASFELDAGVRRRDRGRLLIGGAPPRLIRLSEAGAAALDAILAGPGAATAGAAGTAGTRLARRLERESVIHPLPGDGADDPEVTAIVPVLDGGERLTELVRVLAAEGPVIVVDDGSRDGSGERAAGAGARVIRHAAARGPAAARNAGLAAARTELVAFVDADCVLTPGWRRGLAAMLAADPDLALLAPRVRSAPPAPRVQNAPPAPRVRSAPPAPRVQNAPPAPRVGSAPLGTAIGDGGRAPAPDAPIGRGGRLAAALRTAIARYERRASPLDLGPASSQVGPGHRVSYLPAAALLARRDALLELGGFDESMRFGEDVDLVWRLTARGGKARYVPAREVLHHPRTTLAALARQRAGYGSSAPHLRRRHGAAVAPLRPGRHAVAVWTVAALRPRLAPVALAASVALVASRGRDRPSRLGLAALALRGHRDATRHLARALTREWLPLSLALAAGAPRSRRPPAVALLLGALAEAAADGTGGPAELLAALPLRALDHAAYAAGMWREMSARRELGALLPA
ncbi:MAG TPA: glycosyltransferase [Solirubrobacterales bacterium]|nr:glycosyltransferase [Solirubrobacterales bacterium]